MSVTDTRRLTKTATPGIYKRGNSYVVLFAIRRASSGDGTQGRWQRPAT
jgi:hypothetical protein